MAALQLKEVILSLPAPYREVFVMSRFGALTYEEIAHHCGLSVKTVEKHAGAVLRKTGARNRTELAAQANRVRGVR